MSKKLLTLFPRVSSGVDRAIALSDTAVESTRQAEWSEFNQLLWPQNNRFTQKKL